MSFFHRHKLLFMVVIFVGILLYAGFNFWVYRYAKRGSAPSPEALLETVSNKGAGFGGFQGKAQGRIPTPAPRASPAPTATPTPRPTGPGDYACDPYGVCNKYSDEARKQYCTMTYADFRCLDQCGDKEKQCTK